MKARVHSIGLISQVLWLSLNISQHYQHHLFVKLRPFISTYIHSSTKFQHSSILWWSKSSPSSPHSTFLLIKNHQKSSKIIKIPKVLISFGHEIPFTAHFSSFFMAKTSPSWPLLASHLASHLELKGLRRRSGVAESQGSGDDAEPDLAMAGYG